jgi:transposase
VTDVPPEEPPADPRDALIRAQAERIAALEAVAADLREQLAAAERSGSRNSGNSSMPRSSDDLPGKKPPRKQRRAAERAEAKKRGKQPGSPGASMRWEVPDRTEDHYPEGACLCGLDLADAADLGVSRSYQQEEVPVAAAERVQHDLRGARCACGKMHVAPRPAGVPDSALSIGPRLRALAVYLAVTSTPHASTARTPWTSCTTSCSAGPGDLRCRHSPRNRQSQPALPITTRAWG